MQLGSIRRLVALLVLGAFVLAGAGRPMPAAMAAAMPDMAATPCVEHCPDCPDDARGPSKAQPPDCCSDLGCISMVALSPALTPAVTRLSWSPVDFTVLARSPSGLTVAPDLGPPIRIG